MCLILLQSPYGRYPWLKRLLDAADGVTVVAAVSDLTELHTAVGDLSADAVLLPAEVSEAVEFRLLCGLFAALHVGCIRLGERPGMPGAPDLPHVRPVDDADTLIPQLRLAAARLVPRRAGGSLIGRKGRPEPPAVQARTVRA
ncbi:hypothetical protein OG2516_05383 [Oceanicola granulosus HTCC2516]|uniref:Uncharacterized protein n=1 Tax=Oceanicola granulosus (strain ATCC BAA-861 / DSM 15982 / KCTC 12143 / HTCC2516) TaxID=314256 RepID=Q2CIS5_OCEGH|nr:hypothetical protein [Oceanicola granulosus]EAR52514.1 hypothetical protein OG2516_05383 [Oceanicola granulosus HTCC2516]